MIFSRGQYLAFVVVLLLVAFGLRIYALEADAPLDLSPSQELTLDGPVTIAAGRDRALFGSWDPYPGPLQPYRYYPAMNWLAYGFLSLLGTGYWQANFISVITGFLSIAFATAFARQQFGIRVALATALFLAVNYVYIIYNRDPMAYTTVGCGMTLSLYLWGKGLRRPLWFFFSGLTAVFTALFIKLPGIVMLPAALAGFIVLWRRRRSRRARDVYLHIALYGAGSILMAGLWYFLLYLPYTQVVEQAYYVRTFSPAYTWMDNLRFAIQSILLFGVDFGFNLRMLPLFVLAYGYLFYQLTMLLSRTRHQLTAAEAAVLTYLTGTVFMLFASGIRPLRYQILLIPPLSLAGALAIDRWIKRDRLPLPASFNRLYPILVQGLLAYYCYQLLAAALMGFRSLRFDAGPVDAAVAPTIGELYTLVGISLVIAIAGTMAFLWRVVQVRMPYVRLPNPRARWGIALLMIILIFGSDVSQFWNYARAPHYTIMEASQALAAELDPKSTVLGGTYAYTLALGNDFPAIWFYGHSPGPAILESKFTHIVMETDSPLQVELTNDQKLRENLPELMSRSSPVNTYEMRGYLIQLYEFER